MHPQNSPCDQRFLALHFFDVAESIELTAVKGGFMAETIFHWFVVGFGAGTGYAVAQYIVGKFLR